MKLKMNKWLVAVMVSLMASLVMASDPTRPDILQPAKKAQVAVKQLKLTIKMIRSYLPGFYPAESRQPATRKQSRTDCLAK